MYKFSENSINTLVDNASTTTTREFHNRIVLSTRADITVAPKYVSEMSTCSVSQSAIGSEKLSMGSAMSAELSATFRLIDEGENGTQHTTITDHNFTGMYARVDCGLVVNGSITYTPIGIFEITEASSDDSWVTATIKGYDLVGTFFSKSKFSAADFVAEYADKKAVDIFTHIANKNAFISHTVDFRTVSAQAYTYLSARVLNDVELSQIDNKTDREVLGTIAGILGCNVTMAPNSSGVSSLIVQFFTASPVNSYAWFESMPIIRVHFANGHDAAMLRIRVHLVPSTLYHGYDCAYHDRDIQELDDDKIYQFEWAEDSAGIYLSLLDETLPVDSSIEHFTIDTGSTWSSTKHIYSDHEELFGFTIDSTVQHQSGCKLLRDTNFPLDGCTSSNHNTAVTGESYSSAHGTAEVIYGGISFANDIISNSDIDNIAGKSGAVDYGWMGSSYRPMEVTWRGNPRVQVGDIVTVEYKNTEYICYVAKQSLELCGGLKSVISCPIGDDEVSFTSGDFVTPEELSRTSSQLQERILLATQAISGTNGGYISILDLNEDGNPDNIFISDIGVTKDDFEEVEGLGWVLKNYEPGSGKPIATNVVRINEAGIGISNVAGGGAGTSAHPFTVALTGAGIVANAITSGTIDTALLNFIPITTENVESTVHGITINGSQITNIADIPGYSTIIATATSAGSSAAAEQIASLVTEHNLTYIGTDGIYTGNITAKQLQIGWGGTNYIMAMVGANNSNWHDVASTLSPSIDSSTQTPKIVPNASVAGNHSAYSYPFYVSRGAKIRLGLLGKCVQYQTSSIAYVGLIIKYIGTNYEITTSGTQVGNASYIGYGRYNEEYTSSVDTTATNAGYYMAQIQFHNCSANGSYAKDIFVTQTVDGEMIVSGIIKSTDTNNSMRINLNTGTIVTQAENTQTTFSTGKLVFADFAGNDMGGIADIASGDIHSPTLWYSPNYASNAMLAYKDNAGNFEHLLTADTTNIKIFRPLVYSNGVNSTSIYHTPNSLESSTVPLYATSGTFVVTKNNIQYTAIHCTPTMTTNKTVFIAESPINSAGISLLLSELKFNSNANCTLWVSLRSTNGSWYVPTGFGNGHRVLGTETSILPSSISLPELDRTYEAIRIRVTFDAYDANAWVGVRGKVTETYLTYKSRIEFSYERSTTGLDLVPSTGEAAGAIQITSDQGTSSLLELGDDSIYYNHNGLQFADDGLYYNGIKLKFADE